MNNKVLEYQDTLIGTGLNIITYFLEDYIKQSQEKTLDKDALAEYIKEIRDLKNELYNKKYINLQDDLLQVSECTMGGFEIKVIL